MSFLQDELTFKGEIKSVFFNLLSTFSQVKMILKVRCIKEHIVHIMFDLHLLRLHTVTVGL